MEAHDPCAGNDDKRGRGVQVASKWPERCDAMRCAGPVALLVRGL